MAIYFISDVHLGLRPREEEKEKEERLLSFLRTAYRLVDSLYILGDLFDFWFEYATVIPKGFHRTLAALQEFTDRGKAVHYLTGNHDFWIGDYFTVELGIRLHADPFEELLEGKRVYLHHGDGLAEHDLGYRMIKPVLRNKWNIRLYRWLHPDLGVRLARRSSRGSREYTSAKDYGETNGMVQFAAKRFHEGVDIVIMGHRHKPIIIKVGTGTYVNLGDWITYNTYAVLDRGTIELKTWTGTGQADGK